MELTFTAKHTYIANDDTRSERLYTTVYEAMDQTFGRWVFVKEVRIGEGISLEMAMTEVRAMTKAEEATFFTPRIYEAFFDPKKKVLYIVMQLIRGESLRNRMGTAPPLAMLDWMIALCGILAALGRQNLYSKDVKPENIMIADEDSLYLLDFGLSISRPARDVGTYCYRAPEMDSWSAVHETGRGKVDIFAIGVMLYEYFCGECPRPGYEYDLSRRGTAKEWKTFVSPKEKNPDIPDAVNDIIVKCMKLRPEDRYRDMAALKHALKDAKRAVRYGGKGKGVDSKWARR